MYQVFTYDKHVFLVEESEAQDILAAKQAGDDGVFVDGAYIACSNISGVYPEESEDRRSQTLGVMHDGSNAIKQFGQWRDMNGQRDDKGNYLVSYDPQYYPEAAYDRVPTPQEFTKYYLQLNPQDRLIKMLGGQEQYKRLTAPATDPKSLSEMMGSAIERLEPKRATL